tara:strand:+ start:296 stop:619 length:324 start_codon:yes stop_codon:yes gene_type:complete
MGISSMGLDANVLIGVSSGLIGAVGAYIKLKSSMEVLKSKDTSQQKEINDIKESKKEMNIVIHKRIDIMKSELTTLQMEVTKGHNTLQTLMAQMELRIVKEIQKLQK